MDGLLRRALAPLLALVLVLMAVAPAAAYTTRVSLRLRDSLIAKGRVTTRAEALEPPVDGCATYETVVIQRLSGGKWRGVKRGRSDDSGRYFIELPDRSGRYRAHVLGSGRCPDADSKIVRYRK